MTVSPNYSAELAAEICALKGDLPRFDRDASFASDDRRVATYFDFYGFARLAGLFDHYHFGIVGGATPVACHYWRGSPTRATAVILHGLFDHAAVTLPLVEFLLQREVDVVAIDLPEHGLSPQRAGGLRNFSEYGDALMAVLTELAPMIKTPLSLIGHSTGAAAAYDYTVRQAQMAKCDAPAIDRLVLLAPLLRIMRWSFVKTSYRLLGRWISSVPRSFEPCSHDIAFCEFQQAGDPLQARVVSTPWLGAMFERERLFYTNPALPVASLLIQGGQDTTVDASYNLGQYSAKLSKLELLNLSDARHHLLREAEPWRTQVYEAIAEFIRG